MGEVRLMATVDGTAILWVLRARLFGDSLGVFCAWRTVVNSIVQPMAQSVRNRTNVREYRLSARVRMYVYVHG